jgi:hypothetical protein
MSLLPPRPEPGPGIPLTADHARALQLTLDDAAKLIGWRTEPRHLHHDLNFHARWLQRRLESAKMKDARP